MSFQLNWYPEARDAYEDLEIKARSAFERRKKEKQSKSSKIEGLFKQVDKAISYLEQNPKHPSLQCHEYHSVPNPIRPGEKVWEAYAQNRTPGAYRIFWAYGSGQNEITIIAITPHP